MNQVGKYLKKCTFFKDNVMKFFVISQNTICYKQYIICNFAFVLFSVCDDGYYGMNCTSICGNCSENAECYKTTGECPGGCSSSWKPPFCKESKLNV